MRKDFNKTLVRSIDSYRSKILPALKAKIELRFEIVGTCREFYHKIGIRSSKLVQCQSCLRTKIEIRLETIKVRWIYESLPRHKREVWKSYVRQ